MDEMLTMYLVVRHDMNLDWDHPRDTVMVASLDKSKCSKVIEKLDKIPKPDFIDSRSYHIDSVPCVFDNSDIDLYMEEYVE